MDFPEKLALGEKEFAPVSLGECVAKFVVVDSLKEFPNFWIAKRSRLTSGADDDL